MRALVSAALALLTSGCFFYPTTVQYYDSGCELHARRMELQAEVINAPCSGGSGRDGAACLVAYLAIAAGSAVVSGSIVVVGNTVYWFEKRGRCVAKSTFT